MGRTWGVTSTAGAEVGWRDMWHSCRCRELGPRYRNLLFAAEGHRRVCVANIRALCELVSPYYLLCECMLEYVRLLWEGSIMGMQVAWDSHAVGCTLCSSTVLFFFSFVPWEWS